MRKRLLSFVLAVLMIASLLPVTALAADETVTRIAWVQKLVKTFDMTVEADNYPDNYYSDIDSSASYYKDLMIAVEFGVIDLEAGSAFEPDKPATREFAAHTLNFCLGFQLDEGVAYTYTDKDAVTYPEDVQVAVNRGWFQLSGGKFLPEQTVTSAEAANMLADAAKVRKGDKVQAGYDSKYVFTDGVVVVPSSVAAEIADNGSVIIPDTTVALKEGDTFVVFVEDFPRAFKAGSIANDGKQLTVTGEKVDINSVLVSIDAQGVVKGNLAQMQPNEGTQITYILSDDTETPDLMAALNGEKPIKSIHLSRTISGVTVGCDITSIVGEYSIRANSAKNIEAYVAVRGDATATCTIPFSMSAAGLPDTIELGSVPVGFLGSITVSARISVDGSVTLSYNTSFCAGVEYTSSGGFRVIRDFAKGSFTVSADLTLTMGVNITAAITELPVISGRCFAEIGAKCNYQAVTHPEPELPNLCIGIASWMYAKVGCSANISFGRFDETYGKTLDIWDRNNSPVRSVSHFEDDVLVPSCTCDTTGVFGSYFTPVNSRYFNAGRANVVNMPVYKYSLDEDGNATITGYSGSVSALAIPQTIDGHTVVAIGDDAFRGSCLVNVTIPDTVTEIGGSAFENCDNLTNVRISKNLADIGIMAFGNCDALTEIEIPKSISTVRYNEFYSPVRGPFTGSNSLQTITFEDGMTWIPGYILAGCSGFTTVRIPDTVTTIGDGAFRDCEKLESITIPDSVTKIDGSAFENCDNLTNVKISKNLADIGIMAFGNCDALAEIEIPKSISTVRYNEFYSPVRGPFTGSNLLQTITFEDGMTWLPGYILAGCSGFTTVKIPETVTEIGKGAFRDCSRLESITIPDTVTMIGDSAFENCDNLKNVNISENLKKLGIMAFGNCDALTEIEIPKNITTVAYNEFYNPVRGPFTGSNSLQTVVFEEGMTWLPGYILAGCSGFTTVKIPETVTEIGKGAFRDCSRLKSIEIPESVTEIGSHTFSNTKLGSIRVPDTVTDMGDHVFSGCTELKEVTLPNIRQNIVAGMFEGCTSLEKIVLPETVTAIRENAFKNCTSLKDITWSKAPEIIESRAFQNCSALKEVMIPGTVKSIGDCAFLNCDALTTVTIPDSVTSIGEQVFYDCDALTTVKLGSGLTEIPASTFEHCDVLESLRIPRRVTTIGDNAFKDCVKLTSITIPRSVTKISSNAFSYPKILTIYGVAGTYAETFANENSIKFVDQQIKATTASLDKTELTINKGAAAQLNLSVTPENFTDIVDWKSTDTNIVTVSDNGVVKAVGVGTATVKVTVGDVSASCKVTVLQPVTGINLNKSSLTMDALGTFQMTASVYPDGANDKRITWSSSDPAIASVDENGLVTALKKGTATITAAAMDGSGVKSTCKVTVSNTAYVCTDPAQLESPHNYDNSCTDVWSYRLDGASSLNVTFDARTEMEDGFDYLYILDGSGKEVGKYTGKELAGKTVSVPGDTVQIRMASDKGNNAWGFKVTSVKAGSETCQHVWDNGKVTKEPTETETGVKTFTCTRCGETKTEAIPALSHEHSYKDVVTAPTCTEKGYTTHTCACGDSYVDTYVDALGHAWDEGKVTKEPTATETGVRTYTCTRCHETKTESIPVVSVDVTQMFTDVTKNWAYPGIQYCVTHGIMGGMGDGTFAPTGTTTRAQIVQILYNLEGTPAVSGTTPFTDLTANWYKPAILWAYQNNVVAGTSPTTFDPDQPVTREQIAVILTEYMFHVLKMERTWTPADLSTFPDGAQVSSWAKEAMQDAVALGLINGTKASDDMVYLDPQGSATRQQVATILMNFCQNVKK